MPTRRRRLRAFILICTLLALAVGIAQLAGVSARKPRAVGHGFQMGKGYSTFMVRMAPSAGSKDRARLSGAARSLGGGKVNSSLDDGWTEVSLNGSVTVADAQAKLGSAAVDIEPVIPRSLYDQPAPDEAPIVPNEAVVTPPAPDADAGANDDEQLRAGPMTGRYFPTQWSLDQANDIDIDAPEAWALTTGSAAVTVAVIDTGVDATHPDLAGRVLAGRDFSGSATSARTDKVGHGTMVASVVAGAGTGMAGVAPNVKIMPLKVFKDSATGFSMTGYLKAIRYAADNGADVINLSLGCGGTTACYSQAEFDAIRYAQGKGVLVVTASGNGDRAGRALDNDAAATPDFPSGYDLPNILSVTSSDKAGKWSTWANYGRTKVDMAAPGESVVVGRAGGGYALVSGTSFSAPYVSGAAALMRSKQPTLSVPDMRARLLASVVKLPTLAGKSVTGGTLNARAALASTVTGGGGVATVPAAFAGTAPASGSRVRTQPTLVWTLPNGVTARSITVRRAGKNYGGALAKDALDYTPSTRAWPAGLYAWRVIGFDAAGRTAVTPWRSYRVQPRQVAALRSIRFSNRGRTLTGVVFYRSNSMRPKISMTVTRAGRALYRGRALTAAAHRRGAGSPPAATIRMPARLNKPVYRGQRLVITIKIVGDGVSYTQRIAGTVT